MIGAEIVAKARPDGYTLLVGDPALTINSVAQPNRKSTLSAILFRRAVRHDAHALLAHPSFSLTLKTYSAGENGSAKLAMGTTGQGPYMTCELG